MIRKPLSPNPNYKWIVLAIVMLGMVMAMLDSSIVNVSIPKIMADFGSSVTDIEWVVTAYMLGFAVLMPLTAWFRDRVGHKLLYTVSLIIFTVGSLLCGLAWNLPSLIVARVIQSFGGGAMNPTGMAMIAEAFEPRERGKAMGYFGVAIILGPAIGPTLGGFLTEVFGWRSVFLVNLPIGIIGVIMALEMLVADRPGAESHKPFDLWGFVFLTIFLISFLLGMSRGETEGWGSTYIMVCAALAVFGFSSFILTETMVRDRIMDLSLFKHSVFSIAMLITAIRSIALFGGVFLLPLFLQQLKGLTAVQSGLIMMPGALVMAFVMPFVGQISQRSSPRFLAMIGLALLACSMYMYKDISIYMSNWNIILPTIIRGTGMCFLMAPVMTLALNSIPRHKAGMASSMMSIFQQVGGAIGIALLSTVLDNRTKFHTNNMGPMIQSGSPKFIETANAVASRAHVIGMTNFNSVLAAKATIAKFFYMSMMGYGFQDAFVFATGIILLSLIPTLLLPNRNVIHHSQDNIVME
jgi:MFS transporter, DHA2 family, multidrug resistance protein